MDRSETQVLIVGAGPVGLAASLLLARQGVSSIVIEKRETTSNHPKASYFNTRTMEILRSIGVAGDVYEGGAMPAGVAFYSTLTGYNLGNIADDALYASYAQSVRQATASPGCISSQIVLEATLRQHADLNEYIDLRFNHACLSVEQDNKETRATVRCGQTGECVEIASTYLIACDGAHSAIRQQCGRQLLGDESMGQMINVYFEGDIESLVEEQHQGLYWISRPDAAGVFIGLGGDWQKWCYNFYCDVDGGESVESYGEEECLARIQRAIGTTDLPLKILSIGPWQMSAQVIDQFRDGRVFFGGDAAHLTLPTGGFGFNTGMQEIHNLAWKLAYVLRRWADESLLDSYHEERRDIAVYNVETSTKNAMTIRHTGAVFGPASVDVSDIDLPTPLGDKQRLRITDAVKNQRTHFLFLGQEVGFGYWNSPLITADRSAHYAEAHQVEDPVFTYIPNARPGSRTPHVGVVERGSETPTSIHDYIHGGFTCLINADNPCSDNQCTDNPCKSAAIRQLEPGVPFSVYSVGPAESDADLVDVNGTFEERYGVAVGGAVLIRPDGHVAWRASSQAFSVADIEAAIRKSLGENPACS